jgi:hypothetical protein
MGAIARERARDNGDERGRAFGRVIAILSLRARTEPRVSHCGAGGADETAGTGR